MKTKTKKPTKAVKSSGLSVTVGSPSEKIVGTGFYRDAKPGTLGPNEWLDLLIACQDGRATCLRVMEIMEREAALQRPSAHDLAEAFLRWPLPDSVCADLCATKQGPGRVGTNLLSYTEGRRCIRVRPTSAVRHTRPNPKNSMTTTNANPLTTPAKAPDNGVVCDALVSPSEWDDAKFRHAYRPSNQRVALCGYDGPSTRKGEWSIPTNACPICLAVLPDFADLANKRWIQG